MKTRRALLFVIVGGGALVIVLAWMGVFAPKRAEVLTAPSAQSSADIVGKSFTASGANYSITAREFSASIKDGGVTLVDPILTVHPEKEKARGTERITVKAQKGTLDRQPARLVEMAGNVEVTVVGDVKAQLKTDSLSVDLENRTGKTSSKIEAQVETKEGKHALSGRGAQFDMEQQTAEIFSGIELTVTGADLLDDIKKDEPAKEPEAIHAICFGPCKVNGFRNAIELNENVVVQQGKRELKTGRLELQFPEKGMKPERLLAEKGFAFKMDEITASGERFLRTQTEDMLLLSGNPAVVRMEAAQISAARMEVNVETKGIRVPTAGALTMMPPEETGKKAQKIEIQWAGSLRFEPETHLATFREKVRFKSEDQNIECDVLRVKLDEANKQISECFFEGHVKVSGSIASADAPDAQKNISAAGESLRLDPSSESARLKGSATIKQGDNLIKGQDIEIRESAVKVTGGGQMSAATGKANDKVDIAWKGQMSGDDNEAHFKESVSLNFGGQNLQADNVRIQMKDGELQGFVATGKVSLAMEKLDVKADRLTAKAGDYGKIRDLEATGNVQVDAQPRKEGESPILMKSNKMVAQIAEVEGGMKPTGFVATGKVKVVQDELTLLCESLKGTFDKENNPTALTASGGIITLEQRIKERTLLARGDLLQWDMESGAGALTGSPVELREGRSRLYGDKVEFSRKLESLRISSGRRIEGVVEGGDPFKTL